MKYVIVDRAARKVVAVCPSVHHAGLLGQLKRAEGLDVIAPPLENRGFSQFSLEELQYLYWNTTQKSPAELSYGDLVKYLVDSLRFYPVDDTNIQKLERAVNALGGSVTEVPAVPLPPDSNTGSTVTKRAPVKRAPASANGRPAPTSLTGQVWVIADELTAKHGRQATRAEVLAACAEERINTSTASTQFSKWKGHQNSLAK